MIINKSIQHKLHDYLYSQGLISLNTIWDIQVGGKTNKVWRLTGDNDLICKLYINNHANPLFGNSATTEYKCLLWLKGKNIAPYPYKFLETPFGQILLYHFLEGEMWKWDVDCVAKLLRRIHDLEPPDGIKTLSGKATEIKTHGLDIINKLKHPSKKYLLELCPKAFVSEIKPVLIHTDVVPGNLIKGDNSLHLIDWQCPALGDPVVDVVMFLSPGMHQIYGSKQLSVIDRENFLSGLSEELQDRYNTIGLLYHWRLAAYCLWKAEIGMIEYKSAANAEINLLMQANR